MNYGFSSGQYLHNKIECVSSSSSLSSRETMESTTSSIHEGIVGMTPTVINSQNNTIEAPIEGNDLVYSKKVSVPNPKRSQPVNFLNLIHEDSMAFFEVQQNNNISKNEGKSQMRVDCDPHNPNSLLIPNINIVATHSDISTTDDINPQPSSVRSSFFSSETTTPEESDSIPDFHQPYSYAPALQNSIWNSNRNKPRTEAFSHFSSLKDFNSYSNMQYNNQPKDTEYKNMNYSGTSNGDLPALSPGKTSNAEVDMKDINESSRLEDFSESGTQTAMESMQLLTLNNRTEGDSLPLHIWTEPRHSSSNLNHGINPSMNPAAFENCYSPFADNGLSSVPSVLLNQSESYFKQQMFELTPSATTTQPMDSQNSSHFISATTSEQSSISPMILNHSSDVSAWLPTSCQSATGHSISPKSSQQTMTTAQLIRNDANSFASCPPGLSSHAVFNDTPSLYGTMYGDLHYSHPSREALSHEQNLPPLVPFTASKYTITSTGPVEPTSYFNTSYQLDYHTNTARDSSLSRPATTPPSLLYLSNANQLRYFPAKQSSNYHDKGHGYPFMYESDHRSSSSQTHDPAEHQNQSYLHGLMGLSDRKHHSSESLTRLENPNGRDHLNTFQRMGLSPDPHQGATKYSIHPQSSHPGAVSTTKTSSHHPSGPPSNAVNPDSQTVSGAMSMEYRVASTCRDILTDAAEHSLKAVELANTLRARVGTDILSQIREKWGGLLSLLEKHVDIFKVERIPKNDRVSLLHQPSTPSDVLKQSESSQLASHRNPSKEEGPIPIGSTSQSDPFQANGTAVSNPMDSSYPIVWSPKDTQTPTPTAATHRSPLGLDRDNSDSSYSYFGTNASLTQQQQQLLPSKCLHVGNVPSNMTELQLLKDFDRFGTIEGLKIISQRNGSRRFAFVTFKTVEQAITARHCLCKSHPWKGAISFAHKDVLNSMTGISTTGPSYYNSNHQSVRQSSPGLSTPSSGLMLLDGASSSSYPASDRSMDNLHGGTGAGVFSQQRDRMTPHLTSDGLSRRTPPLGAASAGSSSVFQQQSLSSCPILNRLCDDTYVPTQPWPVSIPSDMPYCKAIAAQLQQFGGETTVSKLRGFLRNRVASTENIKSVPLKALLAAYPDYFNVVNNHASLTMNGLHALL